MIHDARNHEHKKSVSLCWITTMLHISTSMCTFTLSFLALPVDCNILSISKLEYITYASCSIETTQMCNNFIFSQSQRNLITIPYRIIPNTYDKAFHSVSTQYYKWSVFQVPPLSKFYARIFLASLLICILWTSEGPPSQYPNNDVVHS
jgi:hypothetical protein